MPWLYRHHLQRASRLLVCDVGHSIDLYAEFTCTGGHYERFPDPKNHRILLSDLRHEKTRALLRAIWTDPHSLVPSKKAAEVTRDIAGCLAKLAKSLEAEQHDPRVIAGFLQRCLLTMFAEDIGLLPEDGFKKLLAQVKQSPHGFPVLISAPRPTGKMPRPSNSSPNSTATSAKSKSSIRLAAPPTSSMSPSNT